MKKYVFLVFGLLMFAACGSDNAADSANQQVTFEPTATSSLATTATVKSLWRTSPVA